MRPSRRSQLKFSQADRSLHIAATGGLLVLVLALGQASSASLDTKSDIGSQTTVSAGQDHQVLAPAPAGCQFTNLDENFLPYALDAGGAGSQSFGSSATQTNGNSPPQFARLVQQLSASNTSSNLGLECQFITGEQLHERFNSIKAAGLRVSSLVVRDSVLTLLGNLPQGFHELKRLVISNTSIDLEVLKEGSESLDQLSTLEIANEKISNIPQNFFQEMKSLRELRLENDEIASLDGDAFHNLDDSLEVLVLRKNRFNRFPMAVKNLAQLAVLDLSDNDIVIDTQENDLPEKLEPLLNLRELVMNRINCTCEFSSSPFFEWIARTHIAGVRCFAPEKLKSQEVIVFERDEFCARPPASAASEPGASRLSPWRSSASSQNFMASLLCPLGSAALAIRAHRARLSVAT